MQYFGFDRPSFQYDYFGFDLGVLDPDAEMKALFAGGKQGVFYKISPVNLWQNAARTIPVTQDGDPVGCIDDLSGNSNHATQTVSASRLTYHTDGVLHWLKQDGVDDYMATADFGLTQPVSAAVAASVHKVVTSTLFDGLVANSGSVVAKNGALRVYSGGGDGAYYPPLITSGKNHVYDVRIAGNNSYVTFDNNPITIRPTSTATMGGITIGALAGNIGGAANDGRFYGMVVVAADLSTTDRQAVKQYLATQAGVTL